MGLFVVPCPGIGCQAAVQSPADVHQFAVHVGVIIDQLITFHHIDTCAGQDEQIAFIFNPDIVVVEIWEIAQLPDISVRIHVTETVAGNYERGAGKARIGDNPQDNFGTESAGLGQPAVFRPFFFILFIQFFPENQNTDSVCTRQQTAVRHFQHRHDPCGVNSVNHLVVLNKAGSHISPGHNRTVRELDHNTLLVIRQFVFCGIDILFSVLSWFKFHQSPSAVADPEVVVSVDNHASDPPACQRVDQPVGSDFVFSAVINRVQSAVSAKVVNGLIPFSLPQYNRIDNLAGHLRCIVYVPEIGWRQAQESQPGRSKPEIALVVREHVINGVVEISGRDFFICAVCVDMGNAVICAYEQFSVVHPPQGFDCCQSAAGKVVQLGQGVPVYPVMVDGIAGGADQDTSVFFKSTAFKIIPNSCQPAGKNHPAFPQQKQDSGLGNYRHVAVLVHYGRFRVFDFGKDTDPLKPGIQRQHHHSCRCADIIIPVSAFND